MEIMRIRPHWRGIRLLMAVSTGLLASCAATVFVEADFPSPLVEPLPVRMGVIMDDALTGYAHYEEIPQQATYTITLGEANVLLLDSLFQSMFVAIEPVEDFPLEAADRFRLDGVLKPELERFEFEVPVGGKDEFVEVWMQYLLRLYETDGQLIAEWPVSGYGKAELGNREKALNRATVVAMREVGAVISTKFSEQPQVEYWLRERANVSALSAEAPLNN